MVGDVPEGTADGALEHEAAKASGMVAAGDGGLHGVGDGIDHRIHGRYRSRHVVPLDAATPVMPSPANSLLSLLLFASVVSERV